MADNVIAIYLRLSCEDTDINSKDESNSITNQRNLIMEYIKSDAVLSTYTVREYIDDGISGTRFDRESGTQRKGAYNVKNPNIKDFSHANLCFQPKVCGVKQEWRL